MPESQLYKATLDIKKHHLTGLMMIKRTDTIRPAEPQSGKGMTAGIYRFVFMNEVGMTFFDLQLDSGELKVISCFASMNKKALIKILETDFRMLLSDISLKNERVYIQEKTGNIAVSGKTGKYSSWQTWSPGGDTLLIKSGKSTIADPAIIRFENYSEGTPKKITIENPFIGMKLTLRKLAR